MVKPNYAFEKRQRDAAKKQKKEEKRQKKALPPADPVSAMSMPPQSSPAAADSVG